MNTVTENEIYPPLNIPTPTTYYSDDDNMPVAPENNDHAIAPSFPENNIIDDDSVPPTPEPDVNPEVAADRCDNDMHRMKEYEECVRLYEEGVKKKYADELFEISRLGWSVTLLFNHRCLTPTCRLIRGLEKNTTRILSRSWSSTPRCFTTT